MANFHCILLLGVVIIGFSPTTTFAAESSEEVATSPDGDCAVTTTAQIPLRACYVEEGKVSLLMARMSAVLGMLNNDQDYGLSKQAALVASPSLRRYELCCDQWIPLLTEELHWVSRRLWQLVIRLEVPATSRLTVLAKRKVDLIRRLENIRVFTGISTPNFNSSLHLLESFDTHVSYLDYGFNVALTSLMNNPSIRPVSPERLGRILIKSLEPFPQLISNWYAKNRENVPRILDLIRLQPTSALQVQGYVSLYEEMKENSDLDSFELTQFVAQLKESLNGSVQVPPALEKRYQEMVEEQAFLLKFLGGDLNCNFKNVAYSNTLYGHNYIVDVFATERHPLWAWTVRAVAGTALFTTANQWYSSEEDVWSTSRRKVKYRLVDVEGYGTTPFDRWKLVPQRGGKVFRILNAKYDEVMFADKSVINSGNEREGMTNWQVFLARHDYKGGHGIDPSADLWTVNYCSRSSVTAGQTTKAPVQVTEEATTIATGTFEEDSWSVESEEI